MGEIIDPRHLRLTLHSANKHTPHNCNIPLMPYLISPNRNSQHLSLSCCQSIRLRLFMVWWQISMYLCCSQLPARSWVGSSSLSCFSLLHLWISALAFPDFASQNRVVNTAVGEGVGHDPSYERGLTILGSFQQECPPWMEGLHA